jgi:hypothetical protein
VVATPQQGATAEHDGFNQCACRTTVTTILCGQLPGPPIDFDDHDDSFGSGAVLADALLIGSLAARLSRPAIESQEEASQVAPEAADRNYCQDGNNTAMEWADSSNK